MPRFSPWRVATGPDGQRAIADAARCSRLPATRLRGSAGRAPTAAGARLRRALPAVTSPMRAITTPRPRRGHPPSAGSPSTVSVALGHLLAHHSSLVRVALDVVSASPRRRPRASGQSRSGEASPSRLERVPRRSTPEPAPRTMRIAVVIGDDGGVPAGHARGRHRITWRSIARSGARGRRTSRRRRAAAPLDSAASTTSATPASSARRRRGSSVVAEGGP